MSKKQKSKSSWFHSMFFGTNGEMSSKRFFGGIGMIIMHIIAIFAVIRYPESSWIGEILITLTVTDAGLLGVGIFEKERKSRFLQRMKEEGIQTPEENYDEREG